MNLLTAAKFGFSCESNLVIVTLIRRPVQWQTPHNRRPNEGVYTCIHVILLLMKKKKKKKKRFRLCVHHISLISSVPVNNYTKETIWGIKEDKAAETLYGMMSYGAAAKVFGILLSNDMPGIIIHMSAAVCCSLCMWLIRIIVEETSGTEWTRRAVPI